MRIGYLILAHTDPAQLRRLIHALDGPDCVFVVHVDQKSDQAAFATPDLTAMENVRFVQDRFRVFWCGFSTVLATMEMVRIAIEWAADVDRLILLSGVCYPVKSNRVIRSTLAEKPDSQFLNHFSLPSPTAWPSQRGGLDRFEKVHWMDNTWLNPRQPVTGRMVAWARGASRRLQNVLPRRKMVNGMKPYGGHQFWMLTRSCAAFLLDRLDHDRALRRFFQRSFGSDEVMFATLIMNSEFRASVINDALRYVDWTREDPAILDDRDFEKIRDSKALFGRKFTTDRSTTLLNRIDQELRLSS